MKKSIVRYLIIFSVVSIIAFIATVMFANINNHKLNRVSKHQLAFVDLESGEVIPFPEFEHKEAGLPKQVCIRNSNGQIVFWGEYDYNTNTMSGDLLSVHDNQNGKEKAHCLLAILNQSSGKKYYLTSAISAIQIENYYITFSNNVVQTENDEENRYYLTVHYCHE